MDQQEEDGNSFQCLFCSVSLSNQQQWKSHLLHEDHQTLTRGKWGSPTVKQNCLLVSSGKNAEKFWILSQFISESKKQGEYPVKNFLWWECRPRTFIVEFETSEDADEVFKEKSAEIGETTFIHLRLARKLLDFEWLAVFPVKVAAKLEEVNREELNLQNDFNLTQVNLKTDDQKSRKRLLDDCSSLTGKPAKAPKFISFDDNHAVKVNTESASKKCAVALLNELAQRRGWLPPMYIVSRTEGGSTCLYRDVSCVVMINGVERVQENFLYATDNYAARTVAQKAIEAILESETAEKKELESIIQSDANFSSQSESILPTEIYVRGPSNWIELVPPNVKTPAGPWFCRKCGRHYKTFPPLQIHQPVCYFTGPSRSKYHNH